MGATRLASGKLKQRLTDSSEISTICEPLFSAIFPDARRVAPIRVSVWCLRLVLALSISVLCLSFVRILCSTEGAWTTFVPTFICTLHFLCAKIWLFGKLVVLLHCKEQKCPFVDVPWCNGSTRVFGSLSPRSNRSGTTSPSPRVLQSFPACKALFPQQCLYDTAFFVYVRKGGG